jgi:hypothetical protein
MGNELPPDTRMAAAILVREAEELCVVLADHKAL